MRPETEKKKQLWERLLRDLISKSKLERTKVSKALKRAHTTKGNGELLDWGEDWGHTQTPVEDQPGLYNKKRRSKIKTFPRTDIHWWPTTPSVPHRWALGAGRSSRALSWAPSFSIISSLWKGRVLHACTLPQRALWWPVWRPTREDVGRLIGVPARDSHHAAASFCGEAGCANPWDHRNA